MNDIHNTEREYKLNNENLKQSEHVSEENKQAISRFLDKCTAEGVGKVTLRKYISNFHTLLKMVEKDFSLLDAEREDLETLVAEVERSDYSASTKKGYKVAIKKFYKVMQGDPELDKYPDKVKWFDTNISDSDKRDPEPVDRSEIEDIIDQCKNDRDRAMYKVLYEAGIRAGELMSLRIRDIDFEKNGVRMKVHGTKKGVRRILLVESERYLRSWLSKHPFSEDDNAPLWVKVDGRNIDEENPDDMALGYDYMRINLKRKAEHAGIRRKTTEKGNTTSEVYPHLFRHSRATHVATEMTEAAMKEFFGWAQSSDMPKTYVHLSGRDIDREIMGMYGIEQEEEEEKEKQCKRCLSRKTSVINTPSYLIPAGGKQSAVQKNEA